MKSTMDGIIKFSDHLADKSPRKGPLRANDPNVQRLMEREGCLETFAVPAPCDDGNIMFRATFKRFRDEDGRTIFGIAIARYVSRRLAYLRFEAKSKFSEALGFFRKKLRDLPPISEFKDTWEDALVILCIRADDVDDYRQRLAQLVDYIDIDGRPFFPSEAAIDPILDDDDGVEKEPHRRPLLRPKVRMAVDSIAPALLGPDDAVEIMTSREIDELAMNTPQGPDVVVGEDGLYHSGRSGNRFGRQDRAEGKSVPITSDSFDSMVSGDASHATYSHDRTLSVPSRPKSDDFSPGF